MTKQHILLVDDDRAFSTLTQEYLESKGVKVTLLHNAEEAWRVFRTQPFHMCILDVKMPIKNGFDLARDIRSINATIPIIFLTGATERESRLEGFHLGADDYVTKPFSMEELWLRMLAIFRRSGTHEEQLRQRESKVYTLGRYRFTPQTRELMLDGHMMAKLTAIEARLLEYFCQSPNGVIERNATLRRIWQDDDYLRGRSLNVYVSKLRQYLRDDPRIEILNVHGEGYQIVLPDL
ncbi:MAG: response regulator transcription factor [Saprospiraceae bacterium]|nr:response regulator transcription factor [Saprospiraceae bacterium]